MELKDFERIRCSFGGHASWAYWTMPNKHEARTKGIGDLSVFDETKNKNLLTTIHTRYILMGLNISNNVERGDVEHFRNFHSDGIGTRDFMLRDAVCNTPLWGAYITDFFVNLVERRAARVLAYARANPKEVDEQVTSRKAELEAIGADQATIIALGNVAYDLLNKHFSGREIIRIPHYAAPNLKAQHIQESVLNIFKNKAAV